MTTDNSTSLQRLKRWAALLRAENNSLGHTLETYAMEWEEDLDALSTAPVQVALPDVDELAQHIRWLNGSNKMGAAVLAEKLLEWMSGRAALAAAPHTEIAQPAAPEPLTDELLAICSAADAGAGGWVATSRIREAIATQAQPATHAEVLTDEQILLLVDTLVRAAAEAMRANLCGDEPGYAKAVAEGYRVRAEIRAALATQAAQQPKDAPTSEASRDL